MTNMTPKQENAIYAEPDNQVPQGPPVRRKARLSEPCPRGFPTSSWQSSAIAPPQTTIRCPIRGDRDAEDSLERGRGHCGPAARSCRRVYGLWWTPALRWCSGPGHHGRSLAASEIWATRASPTKDPAASPNAGRGCTSRSVQTSTSGSQPEADVPTEIDAYLTGAGARQGLASQA